MGNIPGKKPVYSINSLRGESADSLIKKATVNPSLPAGGLSPHAVSARPNTNRYRTTGNPNMTWRKKNPGIAAVLSALFWGSGQIYAESLIIGMYWAIIQLLGIISLGLTWHNRVDLMSWAQKYPNGEITLLLSGIIALFICSFLYIFNIRNAYQLTLKERRVPYEGIDHLGLLLLGGFFLPGLGQMLNGQPKKGSFFLIFSMMLHFFVLSALWIAILWPLFLDPRSFLVVEWVLVVLPFAVGASLLALVFSINDAIRVCMYPGIRENWWKRFKLSWQRRKMGVQLPGQIPFSRLMMRQMGFLFVLVLLFHCAWQFFPRDFYVQNIHKVSNFFGEHKMKVLPDMLDQSARRVQEFPSPIKFYWSSKSAG